MMDKCFKVSIFFFFLIICCIIDFNYVRQIQNKAELKIFKMMNT